MRVTRESATEYREEPLGNVRFVPLIGKEGWGEGPSLAKEGSKAIEPMQIIQPPHRSRGTASLATLVREVVTLGNFYTNAQHYIKNSYPTNCNGVAEYYLDDVSVEEVQLAKCKNDTSICPNDSVVIGNNISEATAYSWQPTNGLSCTNCANPKASPNITTTYTLTKTQCKAVSPAPRCC